MIRPNAISACFNTKDPIYPPEIMGGVLQIPFGEILIRTHSDSPHRKQELFRVAKHQWIYYQDDDCIAPIKQLLERAEPDKLTCAMKPGHLTAYARTPIALIGWGGIFPKRFIEVLDLYRTRYGEDFLYKRETERIMTYLLGVEKQVRLDLPIVDLPSAWAADRLWRQPGHNDYIPQVEQRCQEILTSVR